MRRLLAVAAGLGGLILGSFSAWLCAFLLSRANLPQHVPAGGCSDDEHCDPTWGSAAMMVAGIALPILACAIVSYLSVARSWNARRSSLVIASAILLNLLTVAIRFVR